VTEAPRILLVNPWIHDFAAYDVWARPLGLLTLGAILRHHGYRVSLADCLDRFHPRAPAADTKARSGRGPYLKTPLPSPRGLEDVPRRFSRYGIRPEWLADDLSRMAPPDLVLVTSMMTYWWTGVAETIQAVRDRWPQVPVLLGGVYATLCEDHARAYSGADEVVAGAADGSVLDLASAYTGFPAGLRFDPEDLDSYPYPAYDLQRRVASAALLTSRGCPFRCPYCASAVLQPKRLERSPGSVVAEIRHWHGRHGVRDFAFYDDALLVNREAHALPLLERIAAAALPVRFHAPNALHIREITAETAVLLRRAGFETLRLGLETERESGTGAVDGKVTDAQFEEAVRNLRAAGFPGDRIGVYLLEGLPGQSMEEVAASIQRVRRSGAAPVLAHYTPIPHTPLWPEAVAASRYDLEADPLFTNNAVSPCRKTPFSWAERSRLKEMARSAPPPRWHAQSPAV
jgi:radical SAM superfamily enzyme YgiQ (UPF0313 family)